MYNQQESALKVKQTAKERKIPLKTLLEKCDLNINYISDLSKGNQALVSNIYKIADYLDVSVDYLLGRTDNPNTIQKGITTGDVKGINVTGDTSVKINTTVSKETAELMEMLQDLTLVERSKVVIMIDEMKNKQS